MRDFRTAKWHPLGSRPHVYLVADALADLQQNYLRAVDAWWEHAGIETPRELALPTVRPQYLHATLAWVDRLTADLPPQVWTELESELSQRMQRLRPFAVQVGPAILSRFAIEVYVDPSPPLVELAGRTHEAMRAVLGADLVPEPTTPWRPHISLAYSASEWDDTGLQAALLRAEERPGVLVRPVQLDASEVRLLDVDTFPGGASVDLRWDHDTARAIPIGT